MPVRVEKFLKEMGSVMAKLLAKQGKTALSLKEEGNAAFKLGALATIETVAPPVVFVPSVRVWLS
jgi:hypothetical protein